MYLKEIDLFKGVTLHDNCNDLIMQFSCSGEYYKYHYNLRNNLFAFPQGNDPALVQLSSRFCSIVQYCVICVEYQSRQVYA